MDFYTNGIRFLAYKLEIPQTLCVCFRSSITAIGTRSIRVTSVVVVDIATGVDIPRIVSIAYIGRTQAHILRQPTPNNHNLDIFVAFFIGPVPAA